MIISYFPLPYRARLPEFVYASTADATTSDLAYTVEYDPGGWMIKLKAVGDGYFTLKEGCAVDIFCVGGGGGGGRGEGFYELCGCGGAGGYTATLGAQLFRTGQTHLVTVGKGGTRGKDTTASQGGSTGGTTFVYAGSASTSDVLIQAAGGTGGHWVERLQDGAYYMQHGGGAGGSGGAGGAGTGTGYDLDIGDWDADAPGTDGGNSSGWTSPVLLNAIGHGQGTTTRAFGEVSGELFASGGAGGVYDGTGAAGQNGAANTGNGGAGGNVSQRSGLDINRVKGTNGNGGSGIVIIRNARNL